MLLSDFDFALPEELIAQEPLAQREASRMLLVDRAAQTWHDSHFAAWPAQVRSGDVVVVNNTQVFPARLIGQRAPSGGRVELFLVRERENSLRWEVLAKPARRLGVGQRITFGGNGLLAAEVTETLDDGRRVVQFECAKNDFMAALDAVGQTPLPPYIKRADGNFRADRERYQTVYARERGAIAAPTAGLHFTPATFDELRQRGAQVVEITLHVGYGTFAPVRATDLSQHQVAAESYRITAESADAINAARAAGGRIWAIGTTTTRTLENAADEAGRVRSGAGEAALTITPGYKFRVVGGLLTNFHLPQSSLLLLVSAFAGRELVMATYRHAVAARYRFYSYGDCMLLI